MIRPPRISTPFPSTTLFRSRGTPRPGEPRGRRGGSAGARPAPVGRRARTRRARRGSRSRSCRVLFLEPWTRPYLASNEEKDLFTAVLPWESRTLATVVGSKRRALRAREPLPARYPDAGGYV